MTFILLIIKAAVLIFFGCCHADQAKFYAPSEASIQVDKVISCAEKIIEKKYKIIACGTGIGMPGGIVEELGLAFHTDRTITKAELRILLINCAQILLHEVISNIKIQPFLIKTPFTIKDVEIIIYNHDKNGRSSYDPDVSVASISGGVLEYRSIDPDNPFNYKNIVEETYEEALKIYQNP